MIPNSRPQMKKDQVEKILKAKGCDLSKVNVLAVRGYYLDSMGKKGVNDRGIYDDAVFVCSPTAFVSVNWNTDPSSYRKGRGKGSGKGMATLDTGVWDYKIGPHKGKSPACRQAGHVTVTRDGIDGDYKDTGDFAINHHWGGRGTSSAGCQTAPPNQWPSYINTLVAELKRYDQKTFKYVLIDEAERIRLVAEKATNPIETPSKGDSSNVVNSEIEVLIREFVSKIQALSQSIQPTLPSAPQAPRKFDLGPAIEVIKQFEGCYLQAYKDPVGIPTIGWGTIRYPDGKKVQMGDVCTKDQAETFLMHEVMEKADQVQSLVRVPISNNAFCALVSFAYNVGTDIDADDIAEGLGDSTLLKKLNSGASMAEVASEFSKWIKAGGKVLKGLVRRREAERKLFLA